MRRDESGHTDPEYLDTARPDAARDGTTLDREMRARIYRPARTAMQSGRALTRDWILEFAPAKPQHLSPLMGWPGSGDTQQQVFLRFPTRAVAEAYAKARGLTYTVVTPPGTAVRPKSYADNFRADRLEPWSH